MGVIATRTAGGITFGVGIVDKHTGGGDGQEGIPLLV